MGWVDVTWRVFAWLVMPTAEHGDSGRIARSNSHLNRWQMAVTKLVGAHKHAMLFTGFTASYAASLHAITAGGRTSRICTCVIARLKASTSGALCVKDVHALSTPMTTTPQASDMSPAPVP